MLVYDGIYQQAKERLELLKAQLKLAKIFNAASTFKSFEIQNYYQKEPKFNSVYSRNHLPKIKDEVYVINLDEYESIGTHLEYTNLFSPNDYEKNDKIILG